MSPLEQAEQDLGGLREGFQADGADLQLVSLEGGVATVRLLVTDETCMECIVPGPILEQVVTASLKQALPDLLRVEVEDPRP